MFKVLLVDDERIILDGISSIIDWPALETQLIGTANNGISAFGLIEQQAPDIVISDIRMPGMDGLELIAKVKEHYPSIEFILLSGFGEFEYARQAMRFGVQHYLVKPCNENVITEAIKDVVDELKDRASREQLMLKMEQDLKIDQTWIRSTPDEQESKDESKDHYPMIIHKIIEIIEHNIGNPQLSLQWIANEELFMNADYLGKMFKREIGERFSHYVTKLRIRQAAEYIASTDDVKVFELAEMFGFGDNPQYFSQVFKRQTGFTPSELLKR